jgi:CheY-like chemotaxis protein
VLPPRSTVLVVDDHADTARWTADLLEAAGYQVHAAVSSRAALNAAEAVGPDVVVLEPLMNDGGGWEVAAWLRRRNGSGPMLVALTGARIDRAEARAAGFDFLVLKGGDPRTLVAAVALCAPSDQ